MKNSKPLISIIIPVYNSEKYIHRCLESVINQTYNNIEIIMVDDGSTDGSRGVISNFKDKRIKVIYQKNTGQALARNKGFIESRGDYICFVDSDDIVSKDYVQFLFDGLNKGKTSISVGYFQTFSGMNVPINKLKFNYRVESNLIEIFADKYIMKKMPDFVMQSINAKMFKRYLLEDIDFKSIQSNILEDNIIMAQIMARVNEDRISIIECPLYYYRIHPGSTMQSALNRPIKYGDGLILYPELFKEVMKYIRSIFSDNPNIDKYVYKIESEEFFSLANGVVDRNIKLKEKDQQIQQREHELKEKDQQIQQREHEYNNVLDSNSYKIGYAITAPYRMLKKVARKAIGIFVGIRNSFERKLQDMVIKQSEYLLNKHSKKNNYAVIIHLFYSDLWDLKFKKYLKDLYKLSPFDLYINIPKGVDDKEIVKKITESFPDVCIIDLPNRGRDVLPFVVIFRSLQSKNYDGILKIHSKASIHTQGGSSWMDEILNGLIPKTKKELNSILDVLKSSGTLVGLKSVYISSSTYLAPNRERLDKLLTVNTQNIKTDEIGFFAGTMFWMSGSYKYLDLISIDKFEDESGQTDGTYAHAIERYISMQPQIDNRPLFKIDKEHKISEATKSDIRITDEIDDWERFIRDEK